MTTQVQATPLDPEHDIEQNQPVPKAVLIVSAAMLLLVLLAILAISARRYLPFISDDALISLRYAQRLLQGQGLTWTDGPRVEGYSNLLWVLLVAGLGLFGTDLIDASRMLGVAGMGLMLAAIVWYEMARNSLRGVLPAAIAGLFLVLSGPVVVWAIGGLEQPAVACLLAWAIVLVFRALDRPDSSLYPYLTSLCLGLLCITRPDGALFTAAIMFAILLGMGISRKTFALAFRLSLLPVLFFGGQLVFRLIYYGEWIPNTARVKISPSDQHLLDGWTYVKGGFLALSPFFWWALGFLIALLVLRATRVKGLVLALTAGVWLIYVVFIGGDIFPAWRHFIPVIVVFALALSEGASLFWARVSSTYARIILVLALALSFVPYVQNQRINGENQRAIHERWEWDGQVVGLLLKEAFGEEQPLFAASAAGTLPYWSELPAVDMYGLSDYYIARHPPEDFGEGRIGHELGNGEYVLGRKPDLVSFCGPAGRHRACSRSGKEMSKTDEFAREYTPVLFKGTMPYEFIGMVWVRKYSDKIGIRQTEDTIWIPGYLLVEDSDHAAYLGVDGELVAAASADGILTLELSELADGEWQAEFAASHADEVAYELRRQADGTANLKVWATGKNTSEIREVILLHAAE